MHASAAWNFVVLEMGYFNLVTVKIYDSSKVRNSSVVVMMWWKGLSGEGHAHCSAKEKSFNYINGGGLSGFCQK